MTEEAQSSIETGEISRLFESLSASNIPNLLTDLGILVSLGSQRKFQVGDINYNIPTKDVALKVLVHIYEKNPLVRELFDGRISNLQGISNGTSTTIASNRKCLFMFIKSLSDKEDKKFSELDSLAMSTETSGGETSDSPTPLHLFVTPTIHKRATKRQLSKKSESLQNSI
ncbi:hypothetical protein ADUPG1_006050, partial [Aduncisulcus paluster]